MKTRNILAVTIAGVLSLGALAGAYAASSSGKSGDEDAAEIAAVMTAKNSLSDAVRQAEAETKGMAFKAGMESEDGKSVYEISTVAGDAVTEISIDPASGKVLESDKEGLLSELMRDDEELASLAHVKTNLLQAIAAAEQSAGGKAIEAELDDDSKTPAYKVEVAPADGKLVVVTIDGVSGEILATGPAGDHEDDED